jgi:TrmH family RNA methyltransferase
MPAEPVQSAQNARLKALRALRAGKERAHTALEGRHLLEEALAAKVRMPWILVDEPTLEKEAGLLEQAAASGSEIVACDGQLLKEASGLDAPQGLVAWAERPQPDWQSLLSESAPSSWWMIAAGVQDPGNLGALARVAAAFGAQGMLCLKGGASPWHPRALRGASGTTFRLPVAEGLLAEELFPVLAEAQVTNWATTVDGDDLSEVMASGPRTQAVALWMGEEGRGLAPELQHACQRRVGIPLTRQVESLNVATAAAVVAWALRDQAQHFDGGTV